MDLSDIPIVIPPVPLQASISQDTGQRKNSMNACYIRAPNKKMEKSVCCRVLECRTCRGHSLNLEGSLLHRLPCTFQGYRYSQGGEHNIPLRLHTEKGDIQRLESMYHWVDTLRLVRLHTGRLRDHHSSIRIRGSRSPIV